MFSLGGVMETVKGLDQDIVSVLCLLSSDALSKGHRRQQSSEWVMEKRWSEKGERL